MESNRPALRRQQELMWSHKLSDCESPGSSDAAPQTRNPLSLTFVSREAHKLQYTSVNSSEAFLLPWTLSFRTQLLVVLIGFAVATFLLSSIAMTGGHDQGGDPALRLVHAAATVIYLMLLFVASTRPQLPDNDPRRNFAERLTRQCALICISVLCVHSFLISAVGAPVAIPGDYLLRCNSSSRSSVHITFPVTSAFKWHTIIVIFARHVQFLMKPRTAAHGLVEAEGVLFKTTFIASIIASCTQIMLELVQAKYWFVIFFGILTTSNVVSLSCSMYMMYLLGTDLATVKIVRPRVVTHFLIGYTTLISVSWCIPFLLSSSYAAFAGVLAGFVIDSVGYVIPGFLQWAMSYESRNDEFEEYANMTKFVRWLGHEVRVPANNCLMCLQEAHELLALPSGCMKNSVHKTITSDGIQACAKHHHEPEGEPVGPSSDNSSHDSSSLISDNNSTLKRSSDHAANMNTCSQTKNFPELDPMVDLRILVDSATNSVGQMKEVLDEAIDLAHIHSADYDPAPTSFDVIKVFSSTISSFTPAFETTGNKLVSYAFLLDPSSNPRGILSLAQTSLSDHNADESAHWTEFSETKLPLKCQTSADETKDNARIKHSLVFASPVQVLAVKQRLRQVMRNFLSNASKYGGKYVRAILFVRPIESRDEPTSFFSTTHSSATDESHDNVDDNVMSLLDVLSTGPSCQGTLASTAYPYAPNKVSALPDSERNSFPQIALTSSLSESTKAVEITFLVQDSGDGFTKSQAEKLFKPFSQLRTGLQGSGLGLSLCKAAVVRHGGHMYAFSAGQGKGSTFWFSIPLCTTTTYVNIPSASMSSVDNLHQKSNPHSHSGVSSQAVYTPQSCGNNHTTHERISADMGDVSASSDQYDFQSPSGLRNRKTSQTQSTAKKFRMLVVDDVALTTRLMARILRKLDSIGVVHTAHSGQKALELLEEHGTDYYSHILTDALMPDMDGYQLAQYLKHKTSFSQHGGIVIGVTGNALAEDIATFKRAGADYVITKPIDRSDLVGVLELPRLGTTETQRAASQTSVNSHITAEDDKNK